MAIPNRTPLADSLPPDDGAAARRGAAEDVAGETAVSILSVFAVTAGGSARPSGGTTAFLSLRPERRGLTMDGRSGAAGG
ncbi:MAG: hypothetical protein ACOX8W_03130 [bacterium]